jgi:hypothetical protein
MGGINSYIILAKNLDGNKLLLKLRHKLEDNIKMDMKETGFEGEYWFHLAQNKDQ